MITKTEHLQEEKNSDRVLQIVKLRVYVTEAWTFLDLQALPDVMSKRVLKAPLSFSRTNKSHYHSGKRGRRSVYWLNVKF